MTMITLKNFFLNAVRGVSIGLLVVQPVFAQATVVPAATGPAIVQAPNGVDVVQINTPNSTGVSHNTYDQFNVGPNGLILNNINSNFASTQLGGIIEGNSNLQEGAASVILNEVVGPNPSSLTGYLEVGGTRADVVVANPYGITCNGCGFINADRLTLTTGTPEFSGDHFTGVSVEDGKIAIGENGLDASDALRFDLISRQVDFAGTVKGQEINVVAGRNNVIYATGEIIKKAPNGTSPALSIDSTVLGGMYAGAISITSTEEGVGVKAPQNMSASTGGMTITADGRLVIGKASAKGPVRVKTTRDAIEVQTSLKGENGVEVSSAGDLLISADGRLVAGAAMVLNSGGAINLGADAQVASAGALTVTALDAITLQGGAKLASYSDLLVTSATLSADEGAVIAAGVSSDTPNQGNLTLHVTDRVDLNGAMAAASGDVAVISKIVDIAASGGLPAGKFVAGKSAAFTLTQLHSQDATIRANEALSITGTSGMLSIDGAVVQAGGDVTLSAKALALTSDIQSIAGVLKIASSIGAISTSGTLLGQSVDIDSAGDFTNSGVVQGHSLVDIVAANMVNTGAVQSVDGAVNLTVDQLTTSDTVFGKTAVAIKAATSVSNSGNITSDGGITLVGTGGAPVLTNAKDATIIGNGDVALTLASLSNNGAIASQAGALQINATGAVTNDAFGVLYGHTSSTLKTDGIFTNTGGAVLASGNLTIAGLTNARAAQFANQNGGLVETYAGDISIAADVFENIRPDPAKVITTTTTTSEVGVDYVSGNRDLFGNVISGWQFDIYAGRNNSIYNLGWRDVLNVGEAVPAAGGLGGLAETYDYFPFKLYGTAVYGGHAYRRVATKTVVKTNYTAVGEAAAIHSAGNLTIVADEISNKYSRISAANDISLVAGSIVNLAAESTTHTTVTEQETRLKVTYEDGSDTEVDEARVGSRGTTGSVEVTDTLFATIQAGGTLTGTVTGYIQNGAVAAGADTSGAGGAHVPLVSSRPTAESLGVLSSDISGLSAGSIGNQALVVQSQDPNSNYLLETRYKFINLEAFLSSDYFLSSINYDPDASGQRLGDAYVETQFIRNQLFELTGRTQLGDHIDEKAQMRAMYDNAVQASKNLELSVGVALTPEQIAALTKDIIWLESVTVGGKNVLVPHVYLASTDSLLAASSGASTLTADTISLQANIVANSGAIIANNGIKVASVDVENIGGLFDAGGALNLDLTGTLTSTSGVLSGNSVDINAERVDVKTGKLKFKGAHGFGEAAAGQARITSKTALNITSNTDIVLSGAQVKSGGDAALVANGDVLIGTVDLNQKSEMIYSDGYFKSEGTTQKVTRIETGGDLLIKAGVEGEDSATVTLIGTQIKSAGHVDIASVTGAVDVRAAVNTFNSDFNVKKKGFLSGYALRDQELLVEHNVANISGAQVRINGEGDVRLEGTNFDAEAGLKIKSDAGNVVLATVQDVAASSYYESSSMLGGLISSSSDVRDLKTHSIGSHATVVGNIDLASAQDLTLTSVDFDATGRFDTHVGGDTHILAAVDTDYHAENHADTGLILATTETIVDYTESAKFSKIEADDGAHFDADSAVTIGGFRNEDTGFANAGDLTGEGGADLALTSAFFDDGKPATGPPAAGGAPTQAWMDDLGTKVASLPTAADGPGYVFYDDLITRDTTTVNTIRLVDEHFYEETRALSPAFKVLLTIAITQGMGSLGNGLGVVGEIGAAAELGLVTTVGGTTTLTALGTAVNAFAVSTSMGVLDGAVSGNFDLGDILGDAAFSAIGAGLTSGINAKQVFGADFASKQLGTKGLLGVGNKFTVASLVESGIDATIKSGLSSAVYGTSFGDGFLQNFTTSAVNAAMADLQTGVGDIFANGAHGGEGSLGHIALHAAIGCVAGEALGADCASTAFAATAQAIYAGTDPAADGTLSRTEIENRAELIGALAGYFTSSGKGENVSTGASIAKSGAKNNYLTHSNISEAQTILAECTKERSICEADALAYLKAKSAINDIKLIACAGDKSCLNDLLKHQTAISGIELVHTYSDALGPELIQSIIDDKVAHVGETVLATLGFDEADFAAMADYPEGHQLNAVHERINEMTVDEMLEVAALTSGVVGVGLAVAECTQHGGGMACLEVMKEMRDRLSGGKRKLIQAIVDRFEGICPNGKCSADLATNTGLPSSYTRNADGTINGPGNPGGQRALFRETGQVDANGSPILQRDSGSYFTIDAAGNQQRVATGDLPTTLQSRGETPWQQSQTHIQQQVGGGEKSYLNGVEVPHGTPGSVRPDAVPKCTQCFEVKNYDLSSTSGQNSLVNTTVTQINQRATHLPDGMQQNISIDITGQNVSAASRLDITNRIVQGSNGAVDPDSIDFFIRP